MKNVFRSIIGIVAAIFLLESAVGNIILAAFGYAVLGTFLLAAFVAIRLYIAALQGRRWEQSQLHH